MYSVVYQISSIKWEYTCAIHKRIMRDYINVHNLYTVMLNPSRSIVIPILYLINKYTLFHSFISGMTHTLVVL